MPRLIVVILQLQWGGNGRESWGRSMSCCESVTEWLADLKEGESVAAQRLWQRYVEQLVRLARGALAQSPRRVADEEDVAAVAFANFCRGVEAKRFSRLEDRDDLWQILVLLTERTAIDQLRYERAAKRGGGCVRGESALDALVPDGSPGPGLNWIVDNRPTPEFATQMTEQLEQLLDVLDDDILRRIALDRLAGHTNREISQRLGMSLRSIERQLGLIRHIWDRERSR